MKVWIDGNIVDASDAKIPVRDHGLLYGDGVFEGIRVYGGTVFRLHDHMRRLAFSAAYIGLELPMSLWIRWPHTGRVRPTCVLS
jgi:branched-chain amino acid aminotransferase